MTDTTSNADAPDIAVDAELRPELERWPKYVQGFVDASVEAHNSGVAHIVSLAVACIGAGKLMLSDVKGPEWALMALQAAIETLEQEHPGVRERLRKARAAEGLDLNVSTGTKH